MVSVTVRDLPEESRDVLARRASLSGRSLQEFLRSELIRLASQPSAEELIAKVRRRKRKQAEDVSIEAILKHRRDDQR